MTTVLSPDHIEASVMETRYAALSPVKTASVLHFLLSLCERATAKFPEAREEGSAPFVEEESSDDIGASHEELLYCKAKTKLGSMAAVRV